MKFYKLFKKEIKELITIQAVVGGLAMVLLFVLIGNVMTSVTSDMMKDPTSVVICDNDNSQISQDAIAYLKENDVNAKLVKSGTQVEILASAKEVSENSTVLVIPQGFGAGIEQAIPQQVEIISELTSFAMASDNDNSARDAANLMGDYVVSKMAEAGNINVEFVNKPIHKITTTVVGDKSEQADPNMLKGFGMQQSIFIPIIVFLLIVSATQLNCAAIANEKNDKTLETLLSTPVSRLDVIGSKMCASAVYSLLMAGLFIVGFSIYMGSMINGDAMTDMANNMPVEIQGGMTQMVGLNESLTNLGIKLNAGHFALLGVQLFMTIGIALTISMILGALAKDLKATQGLIMPLMMATMLPYFVTLFADVNTLPTIAKIVLYAIPFTHTFTATGNALFGHMDIFYFGLIYQAIWLVGIVWFAVRVFSSDKIFTASLDFANIGKKSAAKKAAAKKAKALKSA